MIRHGAAAYREMIASTTLLNRVGADLARRSDVHAMTDVTGFGLLGHALEIARASQVSLTLLDDELPLLANAAALAREGVVTGASGRNWASYGESVTLPPGLPDWRLQILTDPQTSGGLLISCEAASAGAILSLIRESGCSAARCVGRVTIGAPACA